VLIVGGGPTGLTLNSCIYPFLLKISSSWTNSNSQLSRRRPAWSMRVHSRTCLSSKAVVRMGSRSLRPTSGSRTATLCRSRSARLSPPTCRRRKNWKTTHFSKKTAL